MRKLSYVVAIFSLALANLAAAQTNAGQPRPNIVLRLTRVSLHGITLSDAEKNGVMSVADTHRPTFESLGQALKTERTELRSARQAHDTVAAITARQAMRETQKQVAAELRVYLTDVRTKLTAADQAKFDENIALVHQAIRRWRNG